MHVTCHNDLPALPADSCCNPELEQVSAMLDARTDDLKRQPITLVVGNHSLAAQVVRLLAERQEENISVQVANELPPTYKPEYWTPAMAEAKAAAWDAQQPRHRSPFTKSQPSPKARKAARRRAKAGRKASR